MSEPIEAAFLVLDPAKHTSGAVVLLPDYGNEMAGEDPHPFEGQYALDEFGKVETQEERERFVQAWIDIGTEMELPLVVVAEVWDPPRCRRLRLPGGQSGFLMDPKWTYQTVLGIGEGWGLWQAELLAAEASLVEDGIAAPPVVRVTPNDWRDELWGKQRAKTTEALKTQAVRYFEGVFGYAVGHDIAEAGCMSLWATTSDRVADVIASGKRSKKSKKGRK
jgi:hypothetical protein